MSDNRIDLQALISGEYAGQRVDQAATALFGEYSRAQIQHWIKSGELTLNGKPCKPKERVFGGERLRVAATLVPQGEWLSEAIPLNILYEDDDILVIDKAAGLVVHPGAGNPQGTVLNALLHRYPGQENLARAGIVHRLDKDTSGLMVVARTLQAQTALVAQLQARTVTREYEAVVQGVPVAGGVIDEPIGRHPRQRTRMAVVAGGRPALSHFRVIQRFGAHSHVRVKLETGRTHQIRVHMAHIGFPLVGDPVYGGRFRLPAGASPELAEALRHFDRQALHAVALRLEHPRTGETLGWNSQLPEDFRQLLEALENG
ncbi:MAG: 23S rRNA pseudouridine(1911/1915/1917) synthase RluD [Porticoccaceae bacterium]